jgi:hypothetical protein
MINPFNPGLINLLEVMVILLMDNPISSHPLKRQHFLYFWKLELKVIQPHLSGEQAQLKSTWRACKALIAVASPYKHSKGTKFLQTRNKNIIIIIIIIIIVVVNIVVVNFLLLKKILILHSLHERNRLHSWPVQTFVGDD